MNLKQSCRMPMLSSRGEPTESKRSVQASTQHVLQRNMLHAEARTFFERALLARLELTAFMRNAKEIAAANGVEQRGWWFAHRYLTLPSGFIEGVSSEVARPNAPSAPGWALDVVRGGGQRIARIVTTYQTNAFAATADEQWFDNGVFCMRSLMRLEDVLSLAATYEATLASLGKHTRRNIRIARKQAERAGITFALNAGATRHFHGELLALRARVRLRPPSSRHVGRFEQFVDASGCGFRSSLRDGNNQLVSYAAGLMRENVAYLIYQLNDGAWNQLSPSLLHRAHLIEHFTQNGITELVFVHGCVGTLRHSCRPIFADEVWLMNPRPGARLLSWAMATILPSGGLTVGARNALRQFAIGEARAT